MHNLKTVNSTSLYIQSSAIFVTLILGIIVQGGELFWFGPAAFSSFSLLFYYIYKNYRKQIELPKSPISILLFIFTLWCFVTVFWSDVPAISLLRAFTIASSLIGLYSYFLIPSHSISWEQIWRVVIAAGLILFIYSCIEVYIGIPAPNSLFLNKNTHAAYLNLIILPTAAYFLLADKSRYKLFLGISLFALVFSHALPGSRGATFGQFIGLGMIFLAGKKHISRSSIKQFLAIYITALTSATLLTSNLFRFFEYKIENADLGRWEIWEGAINLLKDTPWYGSGVGTYWLIHPAYRHINDPSSGQNAHNDYLQYLIEAGIPGLTLLLLLMLTIIYFWWKFISQNDINVRKKIEASGLIGGVASIGFHSFFSFNLGLYSILFLIGLLLGRFIHITGKTVRLIFLEHLPIRKSIFNFSIGTLFFTFTIYFVIISTFSQLYVRGAVSFINKNISEADRYNSLALSIYPYDDRPYLLYVHMYQSILDKIGELTHQKRQAFYNRSLEYLQQAKLINPHREKTYYLHAKLIENNSDLAGTKWKEQVLNLYQQSLRVNPRYLLASRELAKFHLKQGNKSQASDTVYISVKYWQPGFKKTLDYYNFAEHVIRQSGNQAHLAELSIKKDALLASFKKRGIEVKEADFNVSGNELTQRLWTESP